MSAASTPAAGGTNNDYDASSFGRGAVDDVVNTQGGPSSNNSTSSRSDSNTTHEGPSMCDGWVAPPKKTNLAHTGPSRVIRLAPEHLQCLQHLFHGFGDRREKNESGEPLGLLTLPVALLWSLAKALHLVWRKHRDFPKGHDVKGVDSIPPQIQSKWSAVYQAEFGLARHYLGRDTPWCPERLRIVVEQSIKHHWLDILKLVLQNVDLLDLWTKHAIPRYPSLVQLACVADAPEILRRLLDEYEEKEGMDRVKTEVNHIEDLSSPYYLPFGPMTFCALGNSCQCAQILLERGADYDVYLNDRWDSSYREPRTPLAVACREGHLEMVKFLVLHGNAENTEKMVWLAATLGKAEWVKVLAESGVTLTDQTRVRDLTYNSHLPVLEILNTEFGTKFLELLKAHPKSFLHMAISHSLVQRGAPEMLEYLFEKTDYLKVAQPSREDWNGALYNAIVLHARSLEPVRVLDAILNHGDPDLSGLNWVLCSLRISKDQFVVLVNRFGQQSILESMLCDRIESWDQGTRDFYLWLASSARGAPKVVEFLLNCFGNANLNAKDDSGRTALMWASAEAHVEAVKVLLAADEKIELDVQVQ